ncbi:hypothetical protein EIP86_004886 [Pleurotus ostreatoroseus]|nr:hypothetical protein EIP86_004886 [Pleurotus ostreatoroseus]
MAFGLWLGVYDAASFLFDHEVDVVLSAFSLLDPRNRNDLTCAYEPDGHTRQLDFSIWGSPWSTRFRFKASSADNARRPIRCYIGLYFHDNSKPGDNLTAWKDFDLKFGRLYPHPLVSSVKVVIGFRLREDLLDFAENVLGEMPSVSAFATRTSKGCHLPKTT